MDWSFLKKNPALGNSTPNLDWNRKSQNQTLSWNRKIQNRILNSNHLRAELLSP